MLRMVILAGLIALGLAASSAGASEVLQPSGPWKIDYTPNECRLLRTFGTGDAAVTLRFARGAGLDSFDMLIAGKGLPQIRQAHIPVKLRLAPGGIEQVFDGYSMALPDRPEQFIRWFDGDPKILDSVSDGQSLEFVVGRKYSLTINLAKGGAALKGWNYCHAELLKSWGLDPAGLAAQVVRPKLRGVPTNWFTSGAYPTKALHEEKQGTVLVVLSIATTGKITDCRIAVSSKVAELDEKTCRIFRTRASYTPAKGADRQPIKGTDVQRVRWLIPEE